MFNLYVNDIQERLYEGCTLIQYADDCNDFSSSIISEDALNRWQKSLNNLTEFFAENQLNLNASKSEFITFCRKNDTKNVDIDTIVIKGHYVAKKSECKYLGLILDSSLSFHAQTKTILQKMAKGIKTIDTIGQQLPTLSLVALLHCLVLSVYNKTISNVFKTNECYFDAISRETVELGVKNSIFQIEM